MLSIKKTCAAAQTAWSRPAHYQRYAMHTHSSLPNACKKMACVFLSQTRLVHFICIACCLLKNSEQKMEFRGPVCRKYDKKSKGFYSNNNIPHLCTSSHTRELNKLKTTTFNWICCGFLYVVCRFTKVLCRKTWEINLVFSLYVRKYFFLC